MKILKGITDARLRMGRVELFQRRLKDGSEVVIKCMTVTQDDEQTTNPFEKGYTESFEDKTKTVTVKKLTSEDELPSKFGLRTIGDLFIMGEYSDYADFMSAVVVTYSGEQYEINGIKPEDAPIGYDPYYFVAIAKKLDAPWSAASRSNRPTYRTLR